MTRKQLRRPLASLLVAALPVFAVSLAWAQKEAPATQPPWVMLPAVPSGSAAPPPGAAPPPAAVPAEQPPPPPPTAGTPALPPPSSAPPAAYGPGYPPPPSYYPPYSGPVYEPPPPYMPPPTRFRGHIHTGFYFRVGIGLAYHQSSVTFPLQTATGGTITTSSFSQKLSGAGIALDMAIGGAVAPGFILALDLGGHDANVTSSKSGSGWAPSGASYSRLGILADWYINPRAGFHIQGGGGFAQVSTYTQGDYSYYPVSGSGFELNAGVGWETWVARQWGIGALLRFDYANVRGTVDGGDVTMKVATPSLLFTATYN